MQAIQSSPTAPEIETILADLLHATPCTLFIGGTWSPSVSAHTFPVYDPSNLTLLKIVADASAEDGLLALSAASDAFPRWAGQTPRRRAEILLRCFEALKEKAEEFALLITLEMGKPIAESRSEVAYAAEFFRWFAEEAPRIQGRYTAAPNGNGRIMVMQQPVGPVLAITPWNFPLAMGTRKIAPALASGCTVVVKPAEDTPLTMLRLAGLMADCGVPAGVVNVVPTSRPAELCEALTRDRRLRKITFTGSTAIGRVLVQSSAHQLLRSSMELGGNAPFIVFDDCDLERTVQGAVLAKMRNTGEACTAANRFLVQKGIAGEFSSRLTERLMQMKIGPGTRAGVEVGPLINQKQRRRVAELVRDALDKGALLAGQSTDLPTGGWFYPVTVLLNVPDNARLLHEEIFGPVVAIQEFEHEEDAVRRANDSEFGLAAYVWTQNLDRAWRVAAALETGMLGINRGIISDPAAPFGGVKSSGFGREGGTEGIHEYLEPKYVAFE